MRSVEVPDGWLVGEAGRSNGACVSESGVHARPTRRPSEKLSVLNVDNAIPSRSREIHGISVRACGVKRLLFTRNEAAR
jgi:hypothetical protein